MHVLTLCGSTRSESSTARLLAAVARIDDSHYWTNGPDLGTLPLFTPEVLAAGRPESCVVLAKAVQEADAVLIATPEYAHNMPAALKSALEWLVASGEFAGKPTVAITSTPYTPRGEHCMRSLVWTLQALNARVLAEVPIYGVTAHLDADGNLLPGEVRDMVEAVLELLTN